MITGVFVNTAIESAVVDKEVATKKQMQAKNQQVRGRSPRSLGVSLKVGAFLVFFGAFLVLLCCVC